MCDFVHPCTRLPPSESTLVSLRLPAWSSVHSWLLCLLSGSLSAPALLPAPTPVLHKSESAPVRMGRCGRYPLGFGVTIDFPPPHFSVTKFDGFTAALVGLNENAAVA